MSVTDSNIPQEMKDLPRWTLWKLTNVPGRLKPAKIPHSVDGKRADTTDPTTWSTYTECLEKLATYDGLGFVFDPSDNIFGIDYDGVRDKDTGEIDPDILEEVLSLNSYTEVSPSGTGLHVILRGTKPGAACRAGCREMYETGRYFTVTGNHLAGTPIAITSPTVDKIKVVHDKIVSEQATPNKIKAPGTETKSSKTRYTDEEIIAFAMAAKNADKFEALMDGDLSEYNGDHSGADQALCNLLAFYTDDPEQIDRIFRRSDLSRSKWTDRADYRKRTIDRAIENEFSKEIEHIIEDIKSAKAPDVYQIEKMDINFLKEHIGNDNFVCQFMEYAASKTEGYPEYGHQSAVFLLSLIVQRRLKLDLTTERIFPVIWTICFGLSTVSKKSTVSDNAKDVLSGARLSNLLLPEDFTPEALVSEMAVRTEYEKTTKNGPEMVVETNRNGELNSKRGIHQDEYSTFMAAMNKSYNHSMKEMLCYFYNCPPEYDRALRQRHWYLENIYLPVFGNTTLKAFSKVMDSKDIGSGWLPRHLIVNPTYKKKSMRVSKLKEEHVIKRNNLSDFLKNLNEALGDQVIDVDIEDQALEYWNDWIEKRNEELSCSQEEEEATVFGRYSIYALKLAMLYELGKLMKNDDSSLSLISKINLINSVIITLDSVYCAIYLVDRIFVPYYLEVIETTEFNQFNQFIKLALRTLRKKGRVSRSELIIAVGCSSRELDEVIRTLYDRDQIIEYVDTENSKKPKKYYQYQMTEADKNRIMSKLPEKPQQPQTPPPVDKKPVNSALMESAVRWFRDWEYSQQKSINSTNYHDAATEYANKYKADLEQVIEVVCKYAKIELSDEVQL